MLMNNNDLNKANVNMEFYKKSFHIFFGGYMQNGCLYNFLNKYRKFN